MILLLLLLFVFGNAIDIVDEDKMCFRIASDGSGYWGSCNGELRAHRPEHIRNKDIVLKDKPPVFRLIDLDEDNWKVKTRDGKPWGILFLSSALEKEDSKHLRALMTKVALDLGNNELGFGIVEDENIAAILGAKALPALARLSAFELDSDGNKDENAMVFHVDGKFYKSVGDEVVVVVRDASYPGGFREENEPHGLGALQHANKQGIEYDRSRVTWDPHKMHEWDVEKMKCFLAHHLSSVDRFNSSEQLTEFLKVDIHRLKVLLLDDHHSTSLGVFNLFASSIEHSTAEVSLAYASGTVADEM